MRKVRGSREENSSLMGPHCSPQGGDLLTVARARLAPRLPGCRCTAGPGGARRGFHSELVTLAAWWPVGSTRCQPHGDLPECSR